MSTNVAILLIALLLGTSFGLYRKFTDGKFRVSTRQPEKEKFGVQLGQQATLIQFSSAFCQPCRATRLLLNDIASSTPGVRHVEIDAESHLDLVRELGVTRTPTTFVLDSVGSVVGKSVGLPKRQDVTNLVLALQHTASQ